jgi:O-acetylhomoserine/O-acetylserine sulfhydrylase-like pyridoxal-dependent enzyme
MQAATKYIGGHSDIMFGTISANAKAWPQLAEGIRLLGVCAGPDDVFLALRGTRTLAVRLAQHYRSGLEMARWLASRPEMLRVLRPALESHPGHAIWKRDLTGASGPVQHRPQACAAEGGRRHARHSQTVRHGFFMGRLRKSDRSLRLPGLPHRDQMGAGRADTAASYRA